MLLHTPPEYLDHRWVHHAYINIYFITFSWLWMAAMAVLSHTSSNIFFQLLHELKSRILIYRFRMYAAIARHGSAHLKSQNLRSWDRGVRSSRSFPTPWIIQGHLVSRRPCPPNKQIKNLDTTHKTVSLCTVLSAPGAILTASESGFASSRFEFNSKVLLLADKVECSVVNQAQVQPYLARLCSKEHKSAQLTIFSTRCDGCWYCNRICKYGMLI